MKSTPAVWLLKSEPLVYAYSDLEKAKRATWDGVTNPQAVGNIRQMKQGDLAWIYHTGEEKAIVGLARATSGGYADPQRPGLTADGQIKFAVVDLEPVSRARRLLGLAAIRADPHFAQWAVLTNSRLSAMAVPPAIHERIKALTGVK